MQQDSEALGLEQVLGVLRRRLPLIVLCAVLSAGIAYGLSKRQAKKYTATASLAFSYDSLSQQIAGLQISGNSSTLLAQQASNVELVKLGDMASKTANLIGHGLSAREVAGSVSVEGQGESNVVSVAATASSPALSAAIANTYTNEFVKEQQSANRQYFRSALAVVDRQLARLSPAQRVGPDGVALQNRAQTLSLLSELHYGNVRVGQEAPVPTSPSSPKTSRNTALGLFVGLVLGLALAFAVERVDRRLRRPDDLARIYRLPVLGTVPKSAAFGTKGDRLAELPPAEAEVFSRIRAHLRVFNRDRDLHTVVVASAAAREGKSTIAGYLAGTAARFGSRVLLIEADLRHPTLAQRLKIQVGPGLAEVLSGAITVDEAIQSVEIEAASIGHRRAARLDVLPAGAAPAANPGGLLESQTMDVVLKRCRSIYDLVVIDTPPLTTVSDALPLLSKVDGIIIVGLMGRSRSDSAEQLQQILASSGAPLLGIIANGAKPNGAIGYALSSYGGKSLPDTSPAGSASPTGELTGHPVSVTTHSTVR